MQRLVTITDGSGRLGRAVAERASRLGLRQRLVVHTPDDPPELPAADVVLALDPADHDAMRSAMAGADVVVLIPMREREDRAAVLAALVDDAVAAGARRIVYSSFVCAAPDASFTFARDHWATEQHIRVCGLPWTFLRGSPFHEVVHWLIGDDGAIRGPGGEGRFSPVARDDLADVVAAVLAAPEQHEGMSYEVTGPETVSLADVAAEFTRVTGRAIRYITETPQQAWASRRASGTPDWLIAGWVGTYLGIAAHELDVVTDVVPQLTGHPGLSLRRYLENHSEDYEYLRAASSPSS
jgi:NAD(P)H dehydrogenase (quinone)